MPPMGMPPNGQTAPPLGPPQHHGYSGQPPNQFGVPSGPPSGPNFETCSGMPTQPPDSAIPPHPSLVSGLPPGGPPNMPPCSTNQHVSHMPPEGQQLGPGDMPNSGMGQSTIMPPPGPPPGSFNGPMPPHYGPPPGMFQSNLPMIGGPPPYMRMGFPPGVPPIGMMPAGHMGMYSTPPPVSNAASGYPGGHIPNMVSPIVTAPHMLPSSNQGPPTSGMKEEEIWVENLASEGKFYYYNMRTRETRWDRPEGVTILRQGEVEKDKPTITPKITPAPMHSSHQSIQSRPSSAAVSAAIKPPDVAAWTQYQSQDGKFYYHNSHTSETTWEKPRALIDWESKNN